MYAMRITIKRMDNGYIIDGINGLCNIEKVFFNSEETIEYLKTILNLEECKKVPTETEKLLARALIELIQKTDEHNMCLKDDCYLETGNNSGAYFNESDFKLIDELYLIAGYNDRNSGN